MTKSKKQIRIDLFRNLFIGFCVVVLFIITAIIAIIYTQGGKITRNGIIETGSVKLDIQANNSDIVIYLDDKQIKSDERLINNITPGLHTIRIESSKFHSWEKQVEVYPSFVSNLQVKLFPLEPKLSQLTQTNIDKLFFSEDGSYAYYLVTDPLVELSEQGFWRVKLEEQELFFRRDSNPEKLASNNDSIISYLSDSDVEIKVDDNNNRLLIQNNLKQTVILYDLTKSNTQDRITNITDLLGFIPQQINWFNNNNSVIASNSELVIEFNIVNREKTIVSYTPKISPVYDTNNTALYTFSQQSNTFYSYQNKILREIVIPENSLPSTITSMKISLDGNVLILKSDQAYYYFNTDKKDSILIYEGGDITDISYDGSGVIINDNGQAVLVNVVRNITDNKLSIKINRPDVDIELDPRFINNSNLVVINNSPLMKLQVAENDGSNIVDILTNTSIDNGYYKFQNDGTSLTVMIEDASVENVLNKNLFKLGLNTTTLPFNL